MQVKPNDRYLVEMWYDPTGQPLSGSITLYAEDDSWRGCVVVAAGPFDSARDVLDTAEQMFASYYGVQLTLFEDVTVVGYTSPT